MAHYLDTSALVKLVVVEDETDALQQWLVKSPRNPVACDLARTELLRAVRRAAPDRALRARQVLDSLILTEVTPSLFEQAGRLDPRDLRILDAIHLSAALDLGDDLDGMVSYDARLSHAARQAGVTVFSPHE